jgi:hypothetical protein
MPTAAVNYSAIVGKFDDITGINGIDNLKEALIIQYFP